MFGMVVSVMVGVVLCCGRNVVCVGVKGLAGVIR